MQRKFLDNLNAACNQAMSQAFSEAEVKAMMTILDEYHTRLQEILESVDHETKTESGADENLAEWIKEVNS